MITNGSAVKEAQYKNNIQKWENRNFLIFSIHLRTAIISNKIPWPLQSLLYLGSTVLNIFFPDNTSAISFPFVWMRYMAELWVTEFQASWKTSYDFQWKKFILLMFLRWDRSVSIQIRNFRIFVSKKSALNILANILISMLPGNFGPHHH